jgi:site-specific DNA-methyltransferase (adenine-specific)
MVSIIMGDCLSVMPTLPENSVDSIITDPPYNISRPIVISRKNLRLKTARRNSDITMDFGEWDKFTPEAFDDFMFAFLTQSYRVLKPTGGVVVFCDRMFVSQLWALAESVGFKGKQVLVWHKTNPVPQFRKKNFVSATEFMSWFVKDNGEGYTFNFGKQTEMHNFIEGPICMGNERLEHPTQKPEYVMRQLVTWFSNVGDTILDPFMGSGTTGVACILEYRDFIGIEIDEKYVQIARKRIADMVGPLFVRDANADET